MFANSRFAARSLASAALVLVSASSAAQTPAQDALKVPHFKTELITNTDSGTFTNIFAIHVLSDGGILAVDATRRRLLVIDSTLKHFKIAADTAPGSPTFFGTGQGGLVPFVGDSAGFVEQGSMALITVDRNGKLGRITALPRASDLVYLGGPAFGKPGFDIKGRLFYRASLQNSFPMFRPDMPDTTFTMPDSAPIIRADLDTRRLDTIAYMRVAPTKYQVTSSAGRPSLSPVMYPISVIDDWAYDRDGTVAVVRGQDYHIDWILPDGTKRSTPKMPINWRRITDEEKQQVVDSVRRQTDSTRQATLTRLTEAAKAAGTEARLPVYPPVNIVPPEQLPEYYPAVKPSSRPRFDLDGNLWVIPGTTFINPPEGGLLYDVIDRNGTIIKRVALPAGRVLSGFGKGGLIYMTVLAATSWTRIERARIIPLTSS